MTEVLVLMDAAQVPIGWAVARPAAGTPSAVREGFPLTRLLAYGPL